jgi:hypothetical protein
MPATLRCFWSYHQSQFRVHSVSPGPRGRTTGRSTPTPGARQPLRAAALLIELDRGSREACTAAAGSAVPLRAQSQRARFQSLSAAPVAAGNGRGHARPARHRTRLLGSAVDGGV